MGHFSRGTTTRLTATPRGADFVGDGSDWGSRLSEGMEGSPSGPAQTGSQVGLHGQRLHSAEIPLDQLFLDPNNPRFAEYGTPWVPDEEIPAAAQQDASRRLLIANFAVGRLQDNIEANGYLPIDRVVVRQIGDDQYVVLEGNRRVCAAKEVQRGQAQGSETPSAVLESLQQIPALIYDGADLNAAWFFQGIRHISGFLQWPAFNKAKLLVDQMQEENLTLTQVGRRFGLTPHGAGQWVRGYKGFEQARIQSDYVTEVDEEAYPYFQELFSRSSIPVRTWLEWDEASFAFKNELNFNELLSWLYPRTEDEEEADPAAPIPEGDFSQRKIATRDDLRTIAYLITEAPRYFEQFRRTLDLERAYSEARAEKFEEEREKDTDRVEQLLVALDSLVHLLRDAPVRALREEVPRSRLIAGLREIHSLSVDLIPETLTSEAHEPEGSDT
jgi:hypothetical protein